MGHDSVTLWLRQLSAGDQDAARQLWNRFSPALIRLAKQNFRGAINSVADEEDLVQSVFRVLWSGATARKWESVENRSELWWLLLAIIRSKAVNRQVYNNRIKRGGGGGSIVPLSQLETVGGDSTGFSRRSINEDEPPPELILIMEEEQQRLLASLRDDVLRSIAIWKLEGYTHEEIADRLGVTTRTVIRKLNLIRETWTQDLPP